MKRPPNIVLTVADDQRGSALGCAGLEAVLTPNLDRLASRGTRFSCAQHFGSCHGGICAPSRAMLHTGHPYFRLHHSLLGATYPPENEEVCVPKTLGQKLKQSGYATFATGKWHNGVQMFNPSFSSAENVFFGGMADHLFTPVHNFDASGAYSKDAARTASGFSTEVFARSAIDFIHSQKNHEEPFFCYCAFTAPHDPRTPPDQWRSAYDPRQVAPFPNMDVVEYPGRFAQGVDVLFDPGSLRGRDESLLSLPRDWAEVQRSIAEYYGMVSHMDEWIGMIHQSVSDIGADEDTIIIHTGDHGLAVGQHGLLGKQNPFQHSLSVPLLMAGPNIPSDTLSNALCYQHDLHPTILEWAGHSGSDEVYFESLNPLISGTSAGRKTIFNAFQNDLRTIRNERYKLIESNVRDSRSSLLFDLEQDPWETVNLIDEPRLRSVVEVLRTELLHWQAGSGDEVDWMP